MRALLFAALLLSGCHRSTVPVDPPVIQRPNYAYVVLPDGRYAILTRTEDGRRQALQELDCAVCSIDELRLILLEKLND